MRILVGLAEPEKTPNETLDLLCRMGLRVLESPTYRHTATYSRELNLACVRSRSDAERQAAADWLVDRVMFAAAPDHPGALVETLDMNTSGRP